MKEFGKLIEKGKRIKKSELPNIPDSELEAVVMGWLWGKCNKDRSNEYEIISSLPKPCQNVYSCRYVTDKNTNDEFIKVFFEPFAAMSIEGFAALGSQKLRDIMKKAVNLFEEHNPDLDSDDFDTLDRFINAYGDTAEGDFADAFESELDNVDYVKYIKTHLSCFGD